MATNEAFIKFFVLVTFKLMKCWFTISTVKKTEGVWRLP